ncbi:MAG: hypothetical protein KC983_01835 [Phycisphaerales bacterium]|nr:hypothetical protein [Phycisphaerales bacterium]
MNKSNLTPLLLTVNAALLAMLVLLQLNSGGVQSAQAAPPKGGIPNAGEQRQQMIEQLEAMQANLDAMRKSIASGQLRVTVANINDLK